MELSRRHPPLFGRRGAALAHNFNVDGVFNSLVSLPYAYLLELVKVFKQTLF
jgi:hypothetical protein